ncbi:MAG: transcriptional regulator [Planctomycetes bacterium]|nr:transcriptional regulator [Planctomycetota bacterium]
MAGKTRLSPAIELDGVVHERVRLAILSALGSHGRLSFNELKALTDTTDGNLSTHCGKLESAGFIRAAKGLFGRRTRTSYEITTAGREALLSYLEQLEKIMGEVRGH